MASQSLYRKWRSQTFDEMVGQEPIIRTLKNALKNDNLGHAYLFTGPRGTGKTTTARLLAKTVNCTNSLDGEPCNECQQCREITAGNSFNVIEIDAASNRGIDSIRELREKVMMPPSTGKYKIYILDEAHMLTTEAFNALLKTLEEPPAYAIFVMATTDVHKMLPTVLSRCQRFDFKRISTRQIVSHLLFVAKEEKVELEKSAAELIARTAAGGMRDALSLFDQAIAYSGEVVSLAQVQSMLGVADPRAISKLITYIANQDSPALLYLIYELSEAGADLRQINTQAVEFWRALMLAKAEADVATILDLTEDEVNEVRRLLPAFALEELTECARLFAQNDLMQRNQGTPQLGLELASLECIELHSRVQAGGIAVKGSHKSQTPTTQETAPRQVTQAPPPQARETETPAPRQNTPPSQEAAQTRQQVHREEPHQPVAPKPQEASLTLQQIIAAWENIKKRAKQKSGLLAAYLQHFQVIDIEGSPEGPVIQIQAANQRHFDSVRDRVKDVEWAMSTEFNQPCKVRLLPPGQSPRANGANQASYSLRIATPPVSAYREPAFPVAEQTEEKTIAPATPPPAQQRSTILETPAEYHVQSTMLQSSAQMETPGTRNQWVTETTERASAPASGGNKNGGLENASVQSQSPTRPQPGNEQKKSVLSKEELGQKVNQNPIVQEFKRTFNANIVNIQSE